MSQIHRYTLLLLCFFFSLNLFSQVSNIIPVPKQVTVVPGKTSSFASLAYWCSDETVKPAMFAFRDNLNRLLPVPVSEATTDKTADIQLVLTKTLHKNEYSLEVGKKIIIKYGSYQAATWALATLAQTVNIKNKSLVWQQAVITDQPDWNYRGLLLDVARTWHEAATIRSIIDICGFYKIAYLQLHLTDDQSFTFPSKAFPQLATPGRHYTENELRELVAYAHARGVAIIPEMDLPGHSTAMRRAMPELFGNPDLRIIDLNKPAVYDAVKILTREMASVFYTSPYIHIGADECNFELFEKLPETKNTIVQKGYKDVHDLHLEYIIEMNKYVKSLGKKTLMWESFKGKGTPYLTIPNDIDIFAWETLYQRPDSLLNNGYTIMNASWKPLYITPGYRWGARFIYNNWNMFKWENWWDAAPSYHAIQLPEDNRIKGAQYCSWEMDDYMEVPEIIRRMPAFSEKTWNKKQTIDFNKFEAQSVLLNKKLDRILYSADLSVHGVLTPVEHEIKYLQNNFTDAVSPQFTNLAPGHFITYTTNGSKPLAASARWNNNIQFDTSVNLQLTVFNARQEEVGYYNNKFRKVPLAFSIRGDYSLPGNVNVMNPSSVIIKEPVTVKVLSGKNSKKMVRYKVNEKDKPGGLQVYNDGNGIRIDKSCSIEAFIADNDNKLIERVVMQVRLEK
jgi:hexosaminidase